MKITARQLADFWDLVAIVTTWDDPTYAEKLEHIRYNVDIWRMFVLARMACRYRFFVDACFTKETRLGWASPARSGIADIFDSIPRYVPGLRDDMAISVEAPRGQGKTTLDQLGLVRMLVFRLEEGIAWQSRKNPDALTISNAVQAFASTPGTVVHEVMDGVDVRGSAGHWSVDTPFGESMFWSRGFRGAIRGIQDRAIRPTLWNGDDLDVDVTSQDILTEEWDLVNGPLSNLGPPDGGFVQLLWGTRVSNSAKTAMAAQSQRWRSHVWAAVPKWPSHPDAARHWRQCQLIWADLSAGTPETRLASARAYYEQHLDVMTEGSEVLDPALSLLDCYVKRWSVGDHTYFADFQQDPIPSGATAWPMTSAMFGTLDQTSRNPREWRYVVGGQSIRLSDMVSIIGWQDPRHSDKADGNDFAALPVVAKDKHGRYHVIAGDCRRTTTADTREMMWQMQGAFKPMHREMGWYYESNGFTGYGETVAIEHERRMAPWLQIPTGIPTPSSENKQSAIARRDSHVSNGWLTFATSLPPEGLKQCRETPKGHDDFPDAIVKAMSRLG